MLLIVYIQWQFIDISCLEPTFLCILCYCDVMIIMQSLK